MILEEPQILIIGSMIAGYLVLRSLEGLITSIRRMKKNKREEEYDEFVEGVENKIFDKDERGLKKKNE